MLVSLGPANLRHFGSAWGGVKKPGLGLIFQSPPYFFFLLFFFCVNADRPDMIFCFLILIPRPFTLRIYHRILLYYLFIIITEQPPHYNMPQNELTPIQIFADALL